MTYSAEEIDALLTAGKLTRIGMGSRRACYRLPDGKHCLKCYRSDAEIAEGKYPGAVFKPLAPTVVREIGKRRFDRKRNTSCQEYDYWLELKSRLPSSLFAAFPQTMELILTPTRGWVLVEELVTNSDGTMIEKVLMPYNRATPDERIQIEEAMNNLMDAVIWYSVRFFDPQNIMLQKILPSEFRLRIIDFEPLSRSFIPIDVLCPAFARLKARRRFNRWKNLYLHGG